MGFFGMDDKPEPSARVKGQPRGVQLSTLHEQGCNMCPLNNAGCKTPKMKPTGSKEAKVYILGTAPSKVDDKQGKPFSDDAGRYVRSRVPNVWSDRVRYGNVIKTYPGQGVTVENKNRDDNRELTHVRNPEYIEIECCRPQVRADILKIKPEAVVVVGAVALRWIANETHSYLWQGRRFPATITDGDDEHTFWVYPMTHPYDVIKNRRWNGHVPDDEVTWARQFRAIFRELGQNDKAPTVISEKGAMKGVEWVMGEGKIDLRRIEKHLNRAFAHCGGASSPTFAATMNSTDGKKGKGMTSSEKSIEAVAERADFGPAYDGEDYVTLTFRVRKDQCAIPGIWDLTPRRPGTLDWAVTKWSSNTWRTQILVCWEGGESW